MIITAITAEKKQYQGGRIFSILMHPLFQLLPILLILLPTTKPSFPSFAAGNNNCDKDDIVGTAVRSPPLVEDGSFFPPAPFLPLFDRLVFFCYHLNQQRHWYWLRPKHLRVFINICIVGVKFHCSVIGGDDIIDTIVSLSSFSSFSSFSLFKQRIMPAKRHRSKHLYRSKRKKIRNVINIGV